MRTGLLNKNYSTSRMDQSTEPPQNPLNLLHETCERLLNECAHRNRKSLKFRFIDLKSTDLNCNLQTGNVLHNHHYNEMNSTSTCHSNNNNNNNNNKYGICNQKLFQYNTNIPSNEEILDYSMNPIKSSSSPTSSSLYHHHLLLLHLLLLLQAQIPQIIQHYQQMLQFQRHPMHYSIIQCPISHILVLLHTL
ncbi:unnamed protein product [Trichobilharzia szidati]|nr:unnamed protein product [Trichobilharzia szidati]